MRAWIATVLLLVGSMSSAVAFVAPGALAEPTPGLGCRLPAAGVPLPRIVPEAELALDYISYDEARVCMELVNRSAPQYVEIRELGQSAGWTLRDGSKYARPVFMVEITNEASAIPFEKKLKNVYFLSIHGNEKGGREGGLRVIEDLARGIGIAAEYPKLREYLDYIVAVFVFPNIDGWTHEELEPFLANPAGGGFTRGNGNGADLNRQWPNKGWNRESYRSMSQPEIVNAVKALKQYSNWAFGTDIHGMLTPSDGDPSALLTATQPNPRQPGGSLLMGMLSAGQSDPVKMLETTRLATLLKERVDADPAFAEWRRAPNTGLWGGEVMHWGTSWDTIGYVDSGFTGDFIFQRHGFNSGNIDFELSYNHIVTDNHYAGLGMELNRLHVRAVRQVVAVFLDAAAADVQVSYETGGKRTAYLENPKVFTNRDERGGLEELGGHAAANPFDDDFDYMHVDYAASSNDYFVEVKPFVRQGDRPGVLDPVRAADLTAEKLSQYDTLVIAGSAREQLEGRPAAVQAVSTWVAGGGHLVLTDDALQLLPTFGGIGDASIKRAIGYAGHTNFLDRSHALAAGLRGLARQTYEAVPLGYQPGQAPIWYVESGAWSSAGGKAVGGIQIGATGAISTQLSGSLGINLGELPVGSGSIRILGALLPDPTQEYYHPYGLDSYATTYTGNLLFRNLVGWDEIYEAAPVVAENLGQAKPLTSPTAGGASSSAKDGAGVPGFAAWSLLGVAAATVLSAAARRRHR